jgi:amino acid transporter
MATQNYELTPPALREGYFSWASIFAGTFVFLAIEVTFGVLGAAIFASASARTATPMNGGTGWGLGIWMVILSIIAVYYGAKTAGRLSRTTDRTQGMYQGLVVFGMSIFASILVVALAVGSSAPASLNPQVYRPTTVANFAAAGGYWLFVALVLSMIAAGIGGAHGASTKELPPVERRDNLRQVA